MSLVLKGGTLIDGTGKVTKDAVVKIDGSTISAVGPAKEHKTPGGRMTESPQSDNEEVCNARVRLVL